MEASLRYGGKGGKEGWPNLGRKIFAYENCGPIVEKSRILMPGQILKNHFAR